MTDASIKLSLAQARRSLLARQFLDGDETASARPLAALVGSLCWLPALSGASPYLALLARKALTHRAPLDEAILQRHDLALVPGPRGLVWLVPTADAPLARAFAVAEHASREARVAASFGLTARDLDATRAALRRTLESPRTLDEVRASLTASELYPLQGRGRKAEFKSLAGVVLRGLWANGEVTRVPIGHRPDHDACRYTLDPHPKAVLNAADAVDMVAPRWLAAHAPVTPQDFMAAFNVASSRATAALKRLKTVTVTLEGSSVAHYAPADFEPPVGEPEARVRCALLPLHDALLASRAVSDIVLTPEAVKHLRLRAPDAWAPTVLLDGVAVGTWSFDAKATQVTWRLWQDLPTAGQSALEHEAATLSRFIRDELHAAPLHGSLPPKGPPSIFGEITSSL